MKNLLQQLSQAALALDDGDFSEQQRQEAWLGYPAATTEAIQAAEQRLKVTFPEDYQQFLRSTNGLPATSYVEPTFLPVEEIGYLSDFDPELADIWRETGNEEVADQLARSILIAGKEEEQQFLLIPPAAKEDTWQYWKFAHWIPGEDPYASLEEYFESVLEFMQEELNEDE